MDNYKDKHIHFLLEDMAQKAIDFKLNGDSKAYGESVAIACEIKDRFKKQNDKIERLMEALNDIEIYVFGRQSINLKDRDELQRIIVPAIYYMKCED